MGKYETIFILDSSLDKTALDQEVKKIEDLISSLKGKVIKVDVWGNRRLAYPIAKKQQGYYTLIVFEGDGNLLSELERVYKLNESCLRWLTVVSEIEEEAEKETSFKENKEE